MGPLGDIRKWVCPICEGEPVVWWPVEAATHGDYWRN